MHFFYIEDPEELPITEYRLLIGQAMNIGNLYRQGEFEMLSEKEKEEELKTEWERAKREGNVNG